MSNTTTYGISDNKAPRFLVNQWINGNGKTTAPFELSDFDGKFKVLYCFQSWCRGCHSWGFPALQQMTKALKNKQDIVFLAIQTVFEGHEENTYEKLVETQKKYDLKIPFGHDPGDENSHHWFKVMYHYRTGGTPWFILIDKKNNVVFNDFHLNVDKTIAFLNTIQ